MNIVTITDKKSSIGKELTPTDLTTIYRIQRHSLLDADEGRFVLSACFGAIAAILTGYYLRNIVAVPAVAGLGAGAITAAAWWNIQFRRFLELREDYVKLPEGTTISY